MALSAPVKAAALLLFIAAIAGATYGVEKVVGSTVESQLVSVSAARAELNATAGHTVTYLVSVTNRDVAARDVSVRVSGAGLEGESEITTVRGNTTVGVFVPVTIPESVPEGEHALDVSVVSGERVVREREGALTLRVLGAGPGFEQGDAVDATYMGRLSATGRVFNTNDPAIVGVAFPKTDSYRFSQGLLRVQTVPRPTIVQGLYEGMLGMQAGETRTISFGPEKGYGPASEEETFPRDEPLAREITLTNDAQQVPRATFDAYINESGQGDPSAFQAGDVFLLNQNGNDWPYRVVDLSATVVQYKLAAEVGQAYTIYPFWPNASVVAAIDDDNVTFRTTPTTEPGAVFTMKAFWPEMSTITSANETHIVVRHSPPVGFTYTSVSQLGQPREATVKSVDETQIVVAMPSTNPLAGKDLTFDVTVLSITK